MDSESYPFILAVRSTARIIIGRPIMSGTIQMNVFLALLEGRMEDAYDMLRANPGELNRQELSKIHLKILKSADKMRNDAKVEALRKSLRDMLTLNPEAQSDTVIGEAFYRGVVAAENMIESQIKLLTYGELG